MKHGGFIMRKLLVGILAATTVCVGSFAQAEDARTGVYPSGNVPLAPYTPGVKLSNGMMFVSGQIAYVKGAIPAEARDGKHDVEDQTKIVMEKLKSVIEDGGYTMNDAVRSTVFMTDISNYGAINGVYGKYWEKGDMPPARAAVEVGTLPGSKPGAPVLVEISMILFK